MIAFLILLITNLIFTQTIKHIPIESIYSNESINFNIFVDNNNKKINKVSLMYKNINQSEYLVKDMNLIEGNNFNCIVNEHFLNQLDINYFFIVEFDDGGVISNPINNSYLIDVINYKDDYWDEIDASQIADLLVLSPIPNSTIKKEDGMLAVSMFNLNHIDISNINILIDGENVTDKAIITTTFLSIPELDLDVGTHQVSINIINKFGVKYSPYEWSFNMIDDSKKTWFNKSVNQNLKYWSSYSNTNIDNNLVEYYDHNLVHRIDFEWLKINSNIKLSSLENIYNQSKNRYSISFKNDNMKLDLGDFNPYFNNYLLNGSKVRGFNFNTKFKFMSINLIKGELQRAIQTDEYNNSIFISDVDTINKILTIDRSNYTFKRELTALKISFDIKEKILWNLNLFKAKDNISSVYPYVVNADLKIPIDYISNSNSSYLNNAFDDTTYIMPYKDFALNYGDFIENVDSINYLKDGWSGNKPKDNFIIGSELLFKLDEGRTVIHSEINLSMLNENLWESIENSIQLDTLGGDALDNKFMGSIEIPENIFKYNDIFELGFNQVPISPIDLSSDNLVKSLFNMPSVIYEFDSKFNYGNHSIKYIYEKVGPQFNSLGNLYTQSNTAKTSVSDRVRLFDNRLYIHIDYTKQKDGLNLTDENVTQTNATSFNLSLYPGANLPNINIGFSNKDRFNEVSEAYFSEEDTSIVSDNREHTYTSSYNFSINDKILLIKLHDINFSMFITDKKDMLLKQKLSLDSQYYSPRSYNSNLSLSVLTLLNDNWNANLIYNKSSFNNGNDNIESLNYYQEQRISSIDISLKYSNDSFWDKLKIGLNTVNGVGYQDFIYYNFKLSGSHKLLKALNLNWNYDYQIKWISGSQMYKDSIFKIKLVYSL